MRVFNVDEMNFDFNDGDTIFCDSAGFGILLASLRSFLCLFCMNILIVSSLNISLLMFSITLMNSCSSNLSLSSKVLLSISNSSFCDSTLSLKSSRSYCIFNFEYFFCNGTYDNTTRTSSFLMKPFLSKS